MLRLCVLLALFPLQAWAQEAVPAPEIVEEAPEIVYNTAILQGLNKVTARISKLEATVGTAIHFGNLEIIVKRCWQAPPSERPENAALLEIIDRKPDEAPEIVFNGWMFSSSPSLAGLEHPVYDVIVLKCDSRELKKAD